LHRDEEVGPRHALLGEDGVRRGSVLIFRNYGSTLVHIMLLSIIFA
jgi:hypothetical protein